MTPANKKTFERMAEDISTLVLEDPSADTCIYRILRLLHDLTHILTDFYMRPEANNNGCRRTRKGPGKR